MTHTQKKALIFSTPISVSLLVLAIVATAQVCLGQNFVDQYVPDNERLKTFGGYRDGTYSAVISMTSLLLFFAQSFFRDRVHLAEARERTKQAAIYAESLHDNTAVTKDVAKKIEDSLEKWAKERPCLASFKEQTQ